MKRIVLLFLALLVFISCDNMILPLAQDNIDMSVLDNNVDYCDIALMSSNPNGSVFIKWKTVSNVDGYIVKKSNKGGLSKEWTNIFEISGASSNCATVNSYWGEDAYYRVSTYINYNGNKVESSENIDGYYGYHYVTSGNGAQIVSVKNGKKSLTVIWENLGIGTKYELYRSKYANDGYKRIATITANDNGVLSYTDKVKKGNIYYYKVVSLKNGFKSKSSCCVSGFVSNRKKLKITNSNKVKLKSDLSMYMNTGEFISNYSISDELYYYTYGNKYYVIKYQNKKINIYTLNNKMKCISSKKVKLPNHDFWGGFYHGADRNNYIVIGYKNLKESKTKTVIKVIKYSSNWKAVKTAAIYGKASNMFEGIYLPFDAGNVSMDLKGNCLYLFTSREMFAVNGLHHQSNIAFEINTDSMKAKEANESYVSHSFNQFARLLDDDLYLCDHGDAYPRGINITCVKEYSSDDIAEKDSFVTVPFKFLGETGENYTGTTVCGTEISKKNIVVAGTSVPHKKKVKGVKGKNGNRNVYLILTNRNTGKSTFKWLTSFKPNKGNKTVQECRLVKITSNRFAVLYSVYNKKNGKSSFHCMIINENGKVTSNKTYKNVVFNYSSQPIVFNGYIVFADGKTNVKTGYKKTKIYQIPITI